MLRRPAAALVVPMTAALAWGCCWQPDKAEGQADSTAPSASVPIAAASAKAPAASGGAPSAEVPAPSSSAPSSPGKCPPEMVMVAGAFCVDRYELSVVDSQQRQASPYYPILDKDYSQWIAARRAEASRLEEKAPSEAKSSVTPFPELSAWQSHGIAAPVAVSRPGRVPNAYLSMYSAKDACVRADKRLCTLQEWQTACRGQGGTPFPYGESYQAGRCNVFREEHPGHVLFGQFIVGMLDPRMNLVTSAGKPLLRKTGETTACRSVWGEDAIFDMVGNLDEWIDDPDGTFVGGFYARNTKKGCDQVLRGHPAGYMDYSLGARCCRDPQTRN